DFDVDNLPLGYDLGAAQAVIKPGATTGYRVTLGSDASNTIVGFLIYESGEPVALEGGRLRAVEGDDEPVLFFTNSAGRFVTQGVASGRYRVEFGGSNEAVAILVVDPSANGLVDVGELVVADR
ncbi:MAG: hypothetical protein PVI23_16105, partial [Maricaulaceae bacterium]